MRDVAYVALGSNLGDRDGYLRLARERIDALPGARVIAASAVDETAPIGPEGQGAYLNQMVAVETDLAPAALLAALQAIEHEAGRERTVRWGARTLDLDIVLFAAQRVDEPALQVPHPQLPHREFWRRQLAELGVAA
jgi:2-amino-4-hydroxy-6-hydroxymethyldihydropteridine diphosphokinase